MLEAKENNESRGQAGVCWALYCAVTFIFYGLAVVVVVEWA